MRVGIHPRTATDWDNGVRESRDSRFYPDGRRVNYATGEVTMESMSSQPSPVSDVVGSRLLSLLEREKIADLRRAGSRCGRSGGRWAGRRRRSCVSWTLTRSMVGIAVCRASRVSSSTRASETGEARPAGQVAGLRHGTGFREDGSEQIRNRIREEHPDDEGMRVSTETIYQALYFQARGGLRREVAQALRSGRARRVPQKPAERGPAGSSIR